MDRPTSRHPQPGAAPGWMPSGISQPAPWRTPSLSASRDSRFSSTWRTSTTGPRRCSRTACRSVPRNSSGSPVRPCAVILRDEAEGGVHAADHGPVRQTSHAGTRWTALVARDRRCARCGRGPGSARPIMSCIGLTAVAPDLSNLALLCSRCHHDLHRGRCAITMSDGLPPCQRHSASADWARMMRRSPDRVVVGKG